MEVKLPTEAQWEYACRAGAADPLWFGKTTADFSDCANVADKTFSQRVTLTGGLGTIWSRPAYSEPSHLEFEDGYKVTAPVGQFKANPWGLRDMHGNAAEWTRSTYRDYSSGRAEETKNSDANTLKVVRGGSFRDRTERCRSAYRLRYPAWQPVFNVGFRVVCEPRGE
jgi:formylglycine-generating enzyme required for sulfatase activity